MQKILIIGATSATAQEVAKSYAKSGFQLFLVARNTGKLEQVAQDLDVQGAAAVATHACDLTDTSQHDEILRVADKTLDGIDITLIAYGTLPEQKNAKAVSIRPYKSSMLT